MKKLICILLLLFTTSCNNEIKRTPQGWCENAAIERFRKEYECHSCDIGISSKKLRLDIDLNYIDEEYRDYTFEAYIVEIAYGKNGIRVATYFASLGYKQDLFDRGVGARFIAEKQIYDLDVEEVRQYEKN